MFLVCLDHHDPIGLQRRAIVTAYVNTDGLCASKWLSASVGQTNYPASCNCARIIVIAIHHSFIPSAIDASDGMLMKSNQRRISSASQNKIINFYYRLTNQIEFHFQDPSLIFLIFLILNRNFVFSVSTGVLLLLLLLLKIQYWLMNSGLIWWLFDGSIQQRLAFVSFYS